MLHPPSSSQRQPHGRGPFPGWHAERARRPDAAGSCRAPAWGGLRGDAGSDAAPQRRAAPGASDPAARAPDSRRRRWRPRGTPARGVRAAQRRSHSGSEALGRGWRGRDPREPRPLERLVTPGFSGRRHPSRGVRGKGVRGGGAAQIATTARDGKARPGPRTLSSTGHTPLATLLHRLCPPSARVFKQGSLGHQPPAPGLCPLEITQP